MDLKDKPAYPLPLGDKQIDKTVAGETLFESFVKAAMQGYCANPGYNDQPMFNLTQMAILKALAQIEALEKLYEAEKKKKVNGK